LFTGSPQAQPPVNLTVDASGSGRADDGTSFAGFESLTLFLTGNADVVNTGNVRSVLFGGGGNDILTTGSGTVLQPFGVPTLVADELSGEAGDDILSSGAGNDFLNGGLGNDQLFGGDGDDLVSVDVAFDSGSDRVDLGEGMDVVAFGNSNFFESSVQVRVTFSSAEVGDGVATDSGALANQDGGLAVRIQREDSAGALVGSISRYDDEGVQFSTGTATSFDVRDLVSGVERGIFNRVALGTADADSLVFTSFFSNEAVYINAGRGDDVVVAGAGDDFLVGGAGRDVLIGGEGANSFIGGTGDDTITGGSGVDRIVAFNVTTDGADFINLGGGTDIVNVGASAPTNVRLTFTSAEIGNGFASDSGTLANQDGGLAVRMQAETDGTPAGNITRIDDEGVVFVGGAGVTFDVRDLVTGAARGEAFEVVSLGTAGDDTMTAVQNARPYYFNGGGGADRITGGSANDFLVGGGGDDTLDGAGGNDTFLGGGGADILVGGVGDDTASGGDGNDLAFGQAGNDTLNGDEGRDQLFGEEGDDTVNGGGGDDVVDGGVGNDFVFGGSGRDVVIGFDGDDQLFGEGENDVLSGGRGNDVIIGGDGDDVALIDTADDGADTTDLGAGSDLVRVTMANGSEVRLTFTSGEVGNGSATDSGALANQDGGLAVRFQSEGFDGAQTGPVSRFDDEGITFVASAGGTFDVRDLPTGTARGSFGVVALGTGGDDTMNAVQSDRAYYFNAGAGNDTVNGGGAGDFLVGGGGDDVLEGFGGNDTFLAGGGADRIGGGEGNDRANGGDGDDQIFGQGGDDVLNGDAGDDGIFGEVGDDLLAGGTGNDFLAGSDGNDRAFGQNGADTLDGGGGDDSLYGENDDDLLAGGGGRDVLIGGAGNDVAFGQTEGDVLAGDEGDDSLYGEGGDDALFGGAGNDVLIGGEGNDVLRGGEGADVLVGDAGADRFVFEVMSDSPAAGPDRIADFSAGEGDIVDLSGLDADSGVGGDQAFMFVNAFSNQAGQAVMSFDAASGRSTLQLDVNGDSQADMSILFDGQIGTSSGFIL
jgi:Ca2+-binding RTX toxin-like protein